MFYLRGWRSNATAETSRCSSGSTITQRTTSRLPAYGRVGQDLFMLGYQIANNAISAVFDASRRNLPNARAFTT